MRDEVKETSVEDITVLRHDGICSPKVKPRAGNGGGVGSGQEKVNKGG